MVEYACVCVCVRAIAHVLENTTATSYFDHSNN